MKRGLKESQASGQRAKDIDARITPMKRGLKGSTLCTGPGTKRADARITPMKRGLKVSVRKDADAVRVDARITPMKRGLKVRERPGGVYRPGRCKDYPDEKGTERSSQIGL